MDDDRKDGTGDGGAAPGDDPAATELGDTIRRHRHGRYTVQQLAKRAGISVGLISQIERGKGNPSFKTMQKLATALDLRIGDLVGPDPSAEAGPRVVRRDERPRLQLGSEGLVYELLTPNLRGKLEILQTTLPTGFSNRDNPFRHEGEECVFVFTGEVVVGLRDETEILREGDSVTYDSATPHWWENRTDQPASVIGAVTPPTF